MIAIAALLALAVIGAAFGALTRGDAPASPAAAAPEGTSPTAQPTPAIVAGGSAWAAATPTPVATSTPTSTPTPQATPQLEVETSLAICEDVRDGRCIDERRRVGDRGFAALLTFSDSAAGDVASFRLEGPDGQVVDGADITLGGGAGRAWATFRGGLDRGDWTAVAALNGTDVARAEFEAR